MTADRNTTAVRAARPEGPPRSFSPWSLLLAAAVLVTLLLGLWTWLVAILGLALLITMHELGHFLAAKAFGMRVEKFYLGFPPAAVRHTWGETEYGVGVIPLGGFCKISGMTPEEEVPPDTGERVYFKQAVWKRNLTIAAGPLMNFVVAAVVLVLFVAIQGVPTATLKIDQVVAGGPAAKVGITAGATLVGADGQRWTTWDQASAYFRARLHKTITLTYVPAGATVARTVRVTLAENPSAPGKGFLGVGAGTAYARPGPLRGVWIGLAGSSTSPGFKDVVVGTFKGFWWLLSGKISVTGPNGAAGPVGIVSVSQQYVASGVYPILLAYLSFNLGLINLLPILPFDGGHIAVNLVERVRGRRLDPRVLERLVAFGTVLLVMLFILLTFNDVKRLFGG